MAKAQISNVAIKGLCSALPDNIVVSKQRASELEDVDVDKIIENTGIESVYHALDDQTASDLAFVAAEKVLDDFRVNRAEIGALFFVTQTPDYSSPATAFVLQHRLGLSENCLCLDINLGCPGFISGLFSIASAMNAGSISKALLLVAETPSKRIRPSDHSLSLLFGDAGTATLLEKTESSSPWHFAFKSFGGRYKAIMTRKGGYRKANGGQSTNNPDDADTKSATFMDGLEVFYFSTNEVPGFIKAFLRDNALEIGSYDYLVLHQANLMILKHIAKKLKVPMGKVPLSLKTYGNTSSTSIPLTLSKMKQNGISGVQRILMCAFGVGLSWGIVDMTVDFENVLPVVVTEEHFLE